jgi:predicted Zn-dependent peptidase
MADLDAATLGDVREFFRIYYAPNNAALAVTGDFSPADAKRRVAKYFESIPRQPDPPPVKVDEPPLSGEKRVTLSDRLAKLPRYTAAYKTVAGEHADYFALDLLSDILGAGRSSRLYHALVEKRLAINVTASEGESRGPGLFVVQATIPSGGKMEDTEAAIDAEIARVRDGGVTEEELLKARNRARTLAVAQRQTALTRARLLSLYAVYFNDPARINSETARRESVTPAMIQEAARKYLTPENRVAVLSRPSGEAAAQRPYREARR